MRPETRARSNGVPARTSKRLPVTGSERRDGTSSATTVTAAVAVSRLEAAGLLSPARTASRNRPLVARRPAATRQSMIDSSNPARLRASSTRARRPRSMVSSGWVTRDRYAAPSELRASPSADSETAAGSASPGTSSNSTRTPSIPAGESRETCPNGPMSRLRVESRVVDHCASWGPTGLEAVAVAAPTPSETRDTAVSRTRVRVILRKRTVRAVHHREQDSRPRRSTAPSEPSALDALVAVRLSRPVCVSVSDSSFTARA